MASQSDVTWFPRVKTGRRSEPPKDSMGLTPAPTGSYDPSSVEQKEAYILRVMAAIERFDRLPRLSDEASDEIVGYNAYGAFE